MRTSTPALVVALAGLMLTAVVSQAEHLEPAKATKFESSLVNAFNPCLVPNDVTETMQLPGPRPACVPAVASSVSCQLGSGGEGRARVVVLRPRDPHAADLRFSVNATGITACEFQILWLRLDVRITSDDCDDEGGVPVSCTTTDDVIDTLGIPGGVCIVEGGVCRFKTTLRAALPGLAVGRKFGFEIRGCSLFQVGIGQVMSCGLLLP